MKSLFKLSFALMSMLFVASTISGVYTAGPMEQVVVSDFTADVNFVPVQSFQVTTFEVFSVLMIISAGLCLIKVAALISDPTLYHQRHKHRLAFGVAVEFWDTVIARNLYKNYDWLNRAKDRSGNVLSSSVVHIPQAGAVPNVIRNRANYPIPIVKRSDTDITYVIDELSSDTTVVKDAEKWELSYQKIPDILQDHINQVGKRAAQNAIYRWLGKNAGMLNLNAANIRRTTGSAVTTYLNGATGNRNNFLVVDVQAAKTILINQTKQPLNSGKRALFCTDDSYTNLLLDTVFANNQQYDKIGAVFKDGDLIKLLGFDVIRTDVMPRFDNAGTPVAKDGLDPSVANAATDNDVMALVDFDYIHIAKSQTKMFYKAEDPDYQGDVMNALARQGASRERVDQAGVVAIVQQ